MRKFAFGILAVAAILVGIGSAQAASINVITDSGNIGEFTFTNTGITSGTATIVVSVPSLLSTINTVNGEVVPAEPIKASTPTTLMVTPTGGGQYNVNVSPTAMLTVGSTVGQQAIMGFNLTQGDTPLALPNFFNVSGPVTSLLANNDPNLNFAAFSNGLGHVNLTFTATSFTGTSNFAGLFSTVGATAVGNGSFSQSAVPEPTSVVLMGLGLVGAVVVRRFRVRV